MTPATSTPVPARALSCHAALSVAQRDAESVYRDLTPYRIMVVLETDGWHIDYELRDPRLKGGGPHYVVDATTGAIISRRYEQ